MKVAVNFAVVSGGLSMVLTSRAVGSISNVVVDPNDEAASDVLVAAIDCLRPDHEFILGDWPFDAKAPRAGASRQGLVRAAIKAAIAAGEAGAA